MADMEVYGGICVYMKVYEDIPWYVEVHEGILGYMEVYGTILGAPAAWGELVPSELYHQGGLRIETLLRWSLSIEALLIGDLINRGPYSHTYLVGQELAHD